jgi:transposase
MDATGFGVPNKETWFDRKHGGGMKKRRAYVKLHVAAGVRTHIVTAAVVTDGDANDAPHLPELLTTTAANFEVRDVTADKGYLSKRNVAAIERAGGTPFIPFKSNTVRPDEGTAWARMYHYFAYRQAEFLTHYHQRSNVETVFGMTKAKCGDDLRGKSFTAQCNEVLAKVIAHNLCVLIQSFYELGIDPTFGDAPSKVASVA